MTYSEMRTAYELSRQLRKDVFIGAISFLKGFPLISNKALKRLDAHDHTRNPA